METRAFKLNLQHEDGFYWAHVEDLPGCFASGQDFDELTEALCEAISMHLPDYEVLSVVIAPAPPVHQKATARAELVPA